MDFVQFSAPSPDSLHALREFKDKLYFISARKFLSYDLQLKEWQDLPSLVDDPGSGACVLTVEDQMFIFGGRKTPKTVHNFNFNSKTWLSNTDKNAIIYSSCVSNGDKEVVFVGKETDGSSATYNIETKLWSYLKSDPNVDRSGSTVSNLNGRIFVVGGGNPKRTSLVEEFANRTWIPFKTTWSRTFYKHAAINIPEYLIKCSKLFNPGNL